MRRALLQALLSHWRRAPGLAVALVTGIVLATALWTAVQAINAEARASYARAADLLEQGGLPALVAGDGGAIALQDYVALRRAGWAVAPVLQGAARLAGRDYDLVGLDPLSAPVLPAAQDTAQGSGDTDGGAAFLAFIGPPGQLFADPETAAALADAFAEAGLPQLVGSPDVAPGVLIGDVGTVARLLDRPDSLSRLTLLPDQRPDLPPLADIAPALTRTADAPDAGTDALSDSFRLNLTAFGLLSFAVGLFIVHGAIGLAFEQRRSTIRTLRALGVPLSSLTLAMGAELLALALVGGALGVALGYVIAAALLPDVAATLRGLYGAPAAGSLSLRPGWVLGGLAMALTGTLLAAAQALWRLQRLPVLAAAQPRAWRMASDRDGRRQLAAAMLLLGLAGLLSLAGTGLLAAFAALGALLLGAALALPPLLSAGLKALEARARGPLSEWFWADSRQQLPALSLALMALLLALATNIGVSTMVGSFRGTFTGWLDQRLAAEIYVNAGDAETAARIRPALDRAAEAVLPRATADARLNGRPGEVEGLTPHPTYAALWPLLDALPQVWTDFATGSGALINEQLARRESLSPGGLVDIAGTKFTVLGVYADYGNPRPQAALDLAAFTALLAAPPPDRFSLRVAPETVPATIAALLADTGLRADQIIDQRQIKAAALDVFERTFAVTAALNVLTLGVAATAMLTSLLTLSRMRLPQLAPVWALGLPRATLGRLELARAAALAALTAVLAVPLGLVLAFVLLAVVNVEAFGWRLPMHVFPLDWLVLAGLAILAALLAAAWPARRIARQPPQDLLRVFANER
jgi:putative ABC transport system permease protein